MWPEPHLLQGSQVDAHQQQHWGWDDQAWQDAAERLRGKDLRDVEVLTDRLAAPAYEALDPRSAPTSSSSSSL